MPQHPDQVIRGLRRVINGKNSTASQVLKASKELRDYLRQLESANPSKSNTSKSLAAMFYQEPRSSENKDASAN